MKSIKNFIKENESAIFEDIKKLIAIDSSNTENIPSILQVVQNIAERLGLYFHNKNNIIAWAEFGDVDASGNNYLATIAHTDVVPAGEGWSHDPFTVIEKNGWLIGRGIIDDKSSVVLTLYILKYLKEEHIPCKYPVRALFGTDEETGMKDVEYYLKSYPSPLFCFTPDADFPLCNGEKGHYSARLHFPVEKGEIINIKGGFAGNAIPGTATAIIQFAGEWQNVPGVNVKFNGNTAEITATGKSGHASLPEETVNAIGLLVNALCINNVGTPAEQIILGKLQRLHSSTDGSNLGIACDDGCFTPLTLIGGTIEKTANEIIQSVDCRYPTNMNEHTLTCAFSELADNKANVEITDIMPPFYIDADNPAIQACLSSYNEVTKTNSKPFTMGGGTYARHFPCAVSFGPQPHDLERPDYAGFEHGANEALRKEDILLALEVYITAICKLQKLQLA